MFWRLKSKIPDHKVGHNSLVKNHWQDMFKNGVLGKSLMILGVKNKEHFKIPCLIELFLKATMFFVCYNYLSYLQNCLDVYELSLNCGFWNWFQFSGNTTSSEKVIGVSTRETRLRTILFGLLSVLARHVHVVGQKVSVTLETDWRRRKNPLSTRFCHLQSQLLDLLFASAWIVEI